MTELRGMPPNDLVLGCMLDALVSNGCVDEAVALFNRWKASVPPNIVMYSTLIKGFAGSQQAARALEMWREMRAAGMILNTVTYNVLIDAQARVGAMEDVQVLLDHMEKENVAPDIVTFSTIAKGYCNRGDLDRAFAVFKKMQSKGF